MLWAIKKKKQQTRRVAVVEHRGVHFSYMIRNLVVGGHLLRFSSSGASGPASPSPLLGLYFVGVRWLLHLLAYYLCPKGKEVVLVWSVFCFNRRAKDPLEVPNECHFIFHRSLCHPLLLLS